MKRCAKDHAVSILNNLHLKCIPTLARQFSSFSVLGDSQEHLSTEPDAEIKAGDDSDESEPSQPSFKHPSEVFQAASEEPVETSSAFSATANTQ